MVQTVGCWHIETDPDATRECVARRPPGADCPCEGCRNFDAAAGRTFPPEFVAMANALGLDVTKPSEVCHVYAQGPSGLYLTDGWFNVVGSIVSGRDLGWCRPDGSHALQPGLLGSGLSFRLSLPTAPVPEVFAGRSVLQLDFVTPVPWVLAEPPTG